MKMKKILFSTVAASFMLPVLPAAAQLEEIVVLARKREESILKVPVVVSALSGEQLDKYALDDFYSIADQIPGLLINNNVLGIGAQVSLRGVGTTVFDPTIDQSVAINVDGVQMTHGTAYQAASFDMGQLEVLKGPQALFFGKASPGGVIHIQTADPTDEWELIGRTGYEFEAEQKRGEIIVSGPLTDTLGIRLGAQYTDSEGYFKNVGFTTPLDRFFGAKDPVRDDFNTSNTLLGRLTLKWEPIESFDARLKVNHFQIVNDGDAGFPQPATCPEGIRPDPNTGLVFIGNGEDCQFDENFAIVHLEPFAYPGLPGKNNGIRNNGVPFYEAYHNFGSLEFNYDLTDHLTLTSVSGYYNIEQHSMGNATASTATPPGIVVDPDFLRNDFTEEVRITSDFADFPLNFMIGGFYHDGRMEYRNNLQFNLPIVGLNQFNLGRQFVDVESFAGFGQALWQVTPEIELAAGARWTSENRSHRVFTEMCIVGAIPGFPVGCPIGGVGLMGNVPLPLTPVPTATPDISAQNWSPEFTVTYTPTDNLTLFGAFKQAFKSGSFNTVTMPDGPGEEFSYGDERIRGGEVGVKARLFDNQLAINAAAYHYNYTDMQVGANDNTGGLITIITQNAAASKMDGIELDVTYEPNQVDGLTLRGAFNWNRARFVDFGDSVCWGGQSFEEGCNVDLSIPPDGIGDADDIGGTPLTKAPDFTANFGFDYERPIFNDKMTFGISSLTYYSSSYWTSLIRRADFEEDGYVKTNLNLTLRGPNDAWELAFIGNNLSDKITTGTCNVSSTESGVLFGDSAFGFPEPDPTLSMEDERICTPEPGRELWLRLTLRPLEFFKK